MLITHQVEKDVHFEGSGKILNVKPFEERSPALEVTNDPPDLEPIHESAIEDDIDEDLALKKTTVSNLVPCNFCGRQFFDHRIEKHEEVCRKEIKRKRKVVNMTAMRSKGTDNEKYVTRGKKGSTPAAQQVSRF